MKVAAKKQTLKIVTDHITDIICKRSQLGFNYGVILIPEGLIDFVPEVQFLDQRKPNEASYFLFLFFFSHILTLSFCVYVV